MAHNDRLYRSGVLAPRLVPAPAFLRALDQTASESVNGDGGGLWAPLSPMIVGGSGVAIVTAGGFTGGITTYPFVSAFPTTSAIILGDSDWPRFAARTRTVVFPVQDALWAFCGENAGPSASAGYDQSTPGTFILNDASVSVIPFYAKLDSKKFPPGATIASVTVRFRVGKRPTGVPGSLPRIFFACDSLTDNAFLPTPGTVDAYYNAGRPQDLTVVPANNTTVTAGRNYRVHVSDASGTSNIFHSIAVAFTNILDQRPGL